MTTLAPSRASNRAVARPIPEAPPVINAILLCKSMRHSLCAVPVGTFLLYFCFQALPCLAFTYRRFAAWMLVAPLQLSPLSIQHPAVCTRQSALSIRPNLGSFGLDETSNG